MKESIDAERNPLSIAGYSDKFSVRAGETLNFMISTSNSKYDAQVIRLLGGMTDSDSLDFPYEIVSAGCAGEYAGRIQETYCGSYAELTLPEGWLTQSEFEVELWLWATTPTIGKRQSIWSAKSANGEAGAELLLDPEGRLLFKLADGDGRKSAVYTQSAVANREWYLVNAAYSALTATIRIHTSQQSGWTPVDISETVTANAVLNFKDVHVPKVLLASESQPGASKRTRQHYNGKIEDPVFKNAGTVVARYDFAGEISSDRLVDRSGNGYHGILHGAPARAVTSHAWSGEQVDYRVQPNHYAAVHFHDDDVDDAGWEPDITWYVPKDTASGVYALKLQTDEDADYIPFYVRPAKGAKNEPVLFLAPTNTYLAYANEQMFNSTLDVFKGQNPKLNELDLYMIRHPEIGKSIYDTHNDCSGVQYSSRLRPILNCRPHYREWITGYQRHFSADLYIIGWLEKQGHPYNVATDEDLHREGIDLLNAHRVVITGSHPEYWTRPMLQAMEKYLAGGGRLMYLGGNGFYWVTSLDPNKPHLAEIRRGNSGTRTWDSPPGELYHSTTGEEGGLWRHHGYMPQRLLGVGFTAQGSGPGCGFRRLPDSFRPEAKFIFEGIGEDELIGDFGFSLGGAVGDEVDRFDFDLGTPRHAMRLATSTGLGDEYQYVHEEQAMTVAGQGGTEHPLVRADMAYFDIVGGGAVFSVGSMNWATSLGWNDYKNNVVRISDNVLSRFLIGDA